MPATATYNHEELTQRVAVQSFLNSTIIPQFRTTEMCLGRKPGLTCALVLDCKSSRILKAPSRRSVPIVHPARKWFVRRAFRAATVRERSRDCRPINDSQLMEPSISSPVATPELGPFSALTATSINARGVISGASGDYRQRCRPPFNRREAGPRVAIVLFPDGGSSERTSRHVDRG